MTRTKLYSIFERYVAVTFATPKTFIYFPSLIL